MKISKNWLKDYLNFDNYSDEELFKLINMHICEIEDYKALVKASCLSIGLVKECEMHPNSDHLHVCQVEVSSGTIEQIVCGAPNVEKGKKVIVAQVGAVLPGDFKIKTSKIRGVESNGMLCSLEELGIEEKYIDDEFKKGIQLLPEDAPIGENPLTYLGLDDIVINLDLTANRSDLLSIEGVAYDLGAVLDQKVQEKVPVIKECETKNPINITIESESCYQYLARTLRNVKIKPSPQWLKARLIACGVRPINNVVDITNYVMLELGQPLHAFDQEQLGETIIVRNAQEGEKITTLDEVERTLLNTDLVIANEKEALCIAGVMGGGDSEVTDSTQTVVLEAAYFEPLSVRKTSARLGLKSESSTRFERKVDYGRVERALNYAAALMVELAEAEVLCGIAKVVKKDIPKKKVSITVAKINSVLGTNLTSLEVENIFKRLAYSFEKSNNAYCIAIPSRRMDLEASYQDIIEDVARMNGYDSIPTTLATSRTKGSLTKKQKRVRTIRSIFSSLGFNETISYSLIARKDLYLYTLEEKPQVELLMPLTEEHSVMRQSLLNGVLEAMCYNKARKVEHLSFFEIGNTYSTLGEVLKLAGAMTGIYSSCLWKGDKQPSDYFILKGILDTFFDNMNVNVVYKPCTTQPQFHPGRTAALFLGDKQIGIIGELHPRHAREIGLSGTVAFEIELEPILFDNDTFSYKMMNKYPFVTRDLAIVVKKDIDAESILNVVRQTAKKNLVNLEVFDVYTGENVAPEEKSLAIKLTLEDETKTLESADVDKIIKSILNRLEYYFQARLRD